MPSDATSRDKFDPRGTRGVHIGYAQQGAIQILDLESFANDEFRIHISRDFQANRAKFPFKELKVDPHDADISRFSSLCQETKFLTPRRIPDRIT